MKYRNKLLTLLVCLMLGSPAVQATEKEVRTYEQLDKAVVSPGQETPAVVEFFSFYCPPCYAFSQSFGVDKAIRESLPAGKSMVKYHTGFLGSLGPDLTRAWSLAMVLGIEEKVEPLVFDALQVTRTLNKPEDIRAVFEKAGVSGKEYDRMINSPEVQAMTAEQEQLFKAYGVTSTPSVYVDGKYRIKNSAIQGENVEDFRNKYVAVVDELLKKSETTPEKKTGN